MLEIKNLIKKFNNHTVLSGISAKVNKGEVIGVIGPSGSGKSTILRCINFMETPTSGDIFFENTQITEKNIDELRKKIGMVFQLFYLFENMTVLENITFAQEKTLGLTKDVALQNAMKWLEKVGMLDKKNSYPNNLSGGQKQRVAIARSLAMNPEIILFDEPTSALDPENIKEVVETIKSVTNTGITSLIVSHHIKMIQEVATRIWFVDNGQIIADMQAKDFFYNNDNTRIKQFLDLLL
jgi:arginine/lysine/histidine transport system ATP-binding protein